MNRKILDYSDYITQETKKIKEGIITEENDPFFKIGLCQNCNIKLPIFKSESKKIAGSTVQDSLTGEIRMWNCNCGWWQIEEYDGGSFYQYEDSSTILHCTILREFNPSDFQIPLSVLKQEIIKRPTILYDIHSKKMEELAASILSDFYKCDVTICGKSYDGGIDLMLVDGDIQTLVQVKRRKNPSKVEPVSEIRQLLGATLLMGGDSCIYVTTADHFSKESEKAASLAIKKGFVRNFELFDVHHFLDTFNLVVKDNLPPPWNPHWNSFMKKWDIKSIKE